MISWLKSFFEKAKANPKTSGAGTLALLSLIFGSLNAQFDADPATLPAWDVVFAMFIAWFGSLSAADSHKKPTE